MTSLRTFQDQIQEIHTKETLKQRAQAAAEREKDKENKALSTKGKGKENAAMAVEPEILQVNDSEDRLGVEGEIQVCILVKTFSKGLVAEPIVQTLLLSGVAQDHDRARDLIAALMTRHRGEYIFRIGLQPPATALFAGEFDIPEGWSGTVRTEQELSLLQEQIAATVEEVGGKV